MLAIEDGYDKGSMALLDREDINLTLRHIKGEIALDYALKSEDPRTLEEIRKRLAGSSQ